MGTFQTRSVLAFVGMWLLCWTQLSPVAGEVTVPVPVKDPFDFCFLEDKHVIAIQAPSLIGLPETRFWFSSGANVTTQVTEWGQLKRGASAFHFVVEKQVHATRFQLRDGPYATYLGYSDAFCLRPSGFPAHILFSSPKDNTSPNPDLPAKGILQVSMDGTKVCGDEGTVFRLEDLQKGLHPSASTQWVRVNNRPLHLDGHRVIVRGSSYRTNTENFPVFPDMYLAVGAEQAFPERQTIGGLFECPKGFFHSFDVATGDNTCIHETIRMSNEVYCSAVADETGNFHGKASAYEYLHQDNQDYECPDRMIADGITTGQNRQTGLARCIMNVSKYATPYGDNFRAFCTEVDKRTIQLGYKFSFKKEAPVSLTETIYTQEMAIFSITCDKPKKKAVAVAPMQWGDVKLLNSWLPENESPVGFDKDQIGLVRMFGNVYAGEGPAVILPEEYRPIHTEMQQSEHLGVRVLVQIHPSGDVVPDTVSVGGQAMKDNLINLGMIGFRAKTDLDGRATNLAVSLDDKSMWHPLTVDTGYLSTYDAGSFNQLGLWHDQHKNVRLTGMLQRMSLQVELDNVFVVAILPEGAKPIQEIELFAISGGHDFQTQKSEVRILISTDGKVRAHKSGLQDWLSFDGITFSQTAPTDEDEEGGASGLPLSMMGNIAGEHWAMIIITGKVGAEDVSKREISSTHPLDADDQKSVLGEVYYKHKKGGEKKEDVASKEDSDDEKKAKVQQLADHVIGLCIKLKSKSYLEGMVTVKPRRYALVGTVRENLKNFPSQLELTTGLDPSACPDPSTAQSTESPNDFRPMCVSLSMQVGGQPWYFVAKDIHASNSTSPSRRGTVLLAMERAGVDPKHFRTRATFLMVPALVAGTIESKLQVSFESAFLPGFYMRRAEGNNLFMANSDGMPFALDASFEISEWTTCPQSPAAPKPAPSKLIEFVKSLTQKRLLK